MKEFEHVSLTEFLAVPETKPWKEWWNGEVMEKTGGNFAHAVVMGKIAARLELFGEKTDACRAAISLRHINPSETLVFLPDITVMTAPLRGPLRDVPDPVRDMPPFVVEVLAPDDISSRVLRRVALYQEAGITLTWLVDPLSQDVFVCERGRDIVIAPHERPLSAAPVLPGFELDVAALFAFLRPK